MLKSFKYRLMPTNGQEKTLIEWQGAIKIYLEPIS